MADSKLRDKSPRDTIRVEKIENTFLGRDISLWVIIYQDEFYFFGNEVTTSLGFKNSRNAIHDHTDPEDTTTIEDLLGKDFKIILKQYFQGRLKTGRPLFFKNLQPHQKLLNEFALYAVCLGSKLDCVKPFRRWVYQTIVDIRKTGSYNLPASTSFDNPLNMISQLCLKIPKYREEGDNSLRKAMCKKLKEGYNLAKNPYCVKSGRKGGKETQKRIREIKDSFDKLKRKIEKQIEKIESDIEDTLRQISSSENERSSSEDEY